MSAAPSIITDSREAGFRARHARLAAMLVAGMLLTVLMTSLQPFISGTEAGQAAGPNIINQIGFSLAALIGMGAMLTLADRRRLAAALDPAWLIIIGCLVLSAMHAASPGAALRAIAFNIAVLVSALAVIAVPWSEQDFRRAATFAISFVILLCYAGVILIPSLAVHQAGGVEPQHTGLWRGVFSHKNVAGPAFAGFFYFGIYLLRSRRRGAGLAIAALSAIFILGTGSRTTIGLVLIVAVLVLAGRTFDSKRLAVALLLLFLACISLLTVGSVLVPQIGELLAPLIGDPTFTGRTTLWAFGLESIAARPMTGYGFDNFWQTPRVTDAFLPFGSEWDYRGIVNGHNNYIDTVLHMGLPSALLVFWILCFRPLADYLASPRGARILADFWLMVLGFLLLNSLLESSWFRRADPGWILTILAIAGLRLARRSKASDHLL